MTADDHDVVSWKADYGRDVICRRCLTPARGWTWDEVRRCEPCHRAVMGDQATDDLVMSDFDSFGEWWTDPLLDRVGGVSAVPRGAEVSR